MSIGIALHLDADAVDAVRVALAAGAISQADALRTAIGWRLGGLTCHVPTVPRDGVSARSCVGIPGPWRRPLKQAAGHRGISTWAGVAVVLWVAAGMPGMRRRAPPKGKAPPPPDERRVEFFAQAAAGSIWPAGKEPADVRAMSGAP
jgi:hypothetical protein